MKLMFLGTAASEGYPDAFCACANCEQARQLGGFNLRKRSSVLIDKRLLIDLGPDLMAASQIHQVSLAHISFCLQTHEHEDHLDPHHFMSRSSFCGVYGTPILHFYATENAINKALTKLPGLNVTENEQRRAERAAALNLELHVIEPFHTFLVGPYRVTSLAANHAPETVAMLYVIEHRHRTLFYATDTGEIPEATWQTLIEQQFKFNVVAMDHTFGTKERATTHMNREQFLEQLQRMRAEKLLADDARIFAHHLAHHSNPDHETLTQSAEQSGYLVAHDGLCIEV